MQHIKSEAHDCINKGQDCIFGDDSGLPDFREGKAEQPLPGRSQGQVPLFFIAGKKTQQRLSSSFLIPCNRLYHFLFLMKK
ncbi:MAG: hypothetical protein FWG62_05960, partial [Proteobacteria bacterium]|nr:hypothetical protein [Pseudomonadota bacterium]